MRRWCMLAVMCLPLGAFAQAPVVDVPAAWQDALDKTDAGRAAEAISAFVALDRRLRAEDAGPVAQLTRYYILYNLAGAGRYGEVVARWGIVKAADLPDAFRLDLLRIEAEARLETGDPEAALALLESNRSRTGRMDLLLGRALAAVDDVEAARDAIAHGLIAADDATPPEKRAAAQTLLRLLEDDGRLAEAERLRRLADQVYPAQEH